MTPFSSIIGQNRYYMKHYRLFISFFIKSIYYPSPKIKKLVNHTSTTTNLKCDTP